MQKVCFLYIGKFANFAFRKPLTPSPTVVHFTSAPNKNSILAPIIRHKGSIVRRYKNKHFGQSSSQPTLSTVQGKRTATSFPLLYQ
jgi:hypothetical protein